MLSDAENRALRLAHHAEIERQREVIKELLEACKVVLPFIVEHTNDCAFEYGESYCDCSASKVYKQVKDCIARAKGEV